MIKIEICYDIFSRATVCVTKIHLPYTYGVFFRISKNIKKHWKIEIKCLTFIHTNGIIKGTESIRLVRP